MLIVFSILFAALLFSESIFLEVDNFNIGERAFHIDLGKNYAIIADYQGTIHFIDIFTLEKAEFTQAVLPMGGAYDGEFFYVIDNYNRQLLKIKNNKAQQKLVLDSKPVNIKLINGELYILGTNPNKLYIVDSNLFVKKSMNIPVHSPLIRNIGEQVFIPLFDNFQNNVFLTDLLFLIPNNDTYIVNYNNIEHPIDIVGYKGVIYMVSYYNGNLYRNDFRTQPKIAQFGKYTTNIEMYKNNIVGNSLMGGVYYYNLSSGKTEVILEEVPISDISVSPNGQYLYAISHIENKLYVIEDKKVYQTIDTYNYPIDVESPTDNIVLVLCTDSSRLQVIRYFE
ncbi:MULTISPECIES: YncE family protein [Petrotoga]|uniref:DNA-binding beta-propeller fold protein YncE n=4 Tax=Petrotoga TaxID=28236 RepID=A0A4R8F1R2_9BACT|nr:MULTISPECIES: hypothetical protein [Petrotoga]KUK15582.1 MAG: Uncharacterized protein XD53_0989 [Petrotoga mobilis]PNR95566.1 hypothetical protein X929_07470 [Petrotoga olearia DSM 13574]POZ88033.1 hypothetical protein AA80_08140 [Petrotoga sibirica DSM 13575]RMA72632.1 hypothetical protein C8D75_1296 [Petrotoga olearia]TDX17128.1 hypothetical protein C8D74_10272 [Petrotoga sibirica]